MEIELKGRISITTQKIDPQLQTGAEGSGIPPISKAQSGSGEADRGPELSDENMDALIILAFDDPNFQPPGFDGFLSSCVDIISPTGLSSPSQERINRFLNETAKLGILKERPLTSREYLGAFIPTRN